jgi:predicted Zn-dependent protease
MGRYWYQLPWPKRNIKKSISYLEEAVTCAPTTIRGYVYLAESYLEGGEKKLAQECLQKTSALPADITQEVDAGRWRESAKVLLKEKF